MRARDDGGVGVDVFWARHHAHHLAEHTEDGRVERGGVPELTEGDTLPVVRCRRAEKMVWRSMASRAPSLRAWSAYHGMTNSWTCSPSTNASCFLGPYYRDPFEGHAITGAKSRSPQHRLQTPS